MLFQMPSTFLLIRALITGYTPLPIEPPTLACVAIRVARRPVFRALHKMSNIYTDYNVFSIIIIACSRDFKLFCHQ